MTANKRQLKKKIPALRFPEFSTEWVEKRLGEVVDFLDGKRKPLKDSDRSKIQGIYPYYGASGIIDYIDDYIFEEELILLGEDGANIITRNSRLVFLASGKYWVNNHAHVMRSKHENAQSFVCEVLERINYEPFNTGTAQPKLNKEVCAKIPFHLPELPEQKKIASFLSAVDGRIEGLEKKRALLMDYKKGLMQKLFNQSLRFKDDQGNPFPDWEEKKLGEVASKVMEKNTGTMERAVLTNSATQGIVDQSDYFDKDIANQDNLEGYYIVNVDDFVYNPRISVTAPVGPLKRNELRKGVMSPLYTVIRFESGDLSFYQSYFSTTCWHKYMCAVANYGARHDRMNITGSDFFDMPIPYPCLAEQQKIADCLSAVDGRIALVEEQVAGARAFKQGLLQKMFV